MTMPDESHLRTSMVDTQIASRDVEDVRVLEAMRRVPLITEHPPPSEA